MPGQGSDLSEAERLAADLAARLAWAREHPAEVAERAARASAHVAGSFGAQRVARRYARLYDTALG